MPHSISLILGSNSININDRETSATGTYKVRRISISTPEPTIHAHVPDIGDASIVDYQDGDRLAVIRIDVYGDDVLDTSYLDEPLDGVIDLRRWMREAFRYETDGDVNKVQLKVQRENTTNATVHTLRGGWVDDSNSYMRGDIVDKSLSPGVVLTCWLTPYGEAENTITLKNDMYSSPHFVQSTAGLGHGWSRNAPDNGNPAVSMNGNRWLIGGLSQRVVAAANNQGINCDIVPNGSETDVVAYAWVWIDSGAVNVRLFNDTGAATVQQKEVTSGNADKTAVGGGGNTWYRISVSGSVAAGNDCRLQIVAKDGAASFQVDGCYLEYGTTAAPDAWMSARNIDNRNDISAANTNLLNYLDVWGIPGDAPALVRWYMDLDTTTDTEAMTAASRSDGVALAADIGHWVEEDDYDNGLLGAWVAVGGTGTTHDGYFNIALPEAVWTVDRGQLPDISLFRKPFRVFGSWKCDDTDATFKVGFGLLGGIYAWTEEFSVSQAANFELIDMGLINLEGIIPQIALDAGDDPFVYVKVVDDAAASYLRVDFLLLLPVEHYIGHEYGSDHSDTRYIDGLNEEIAIDVNIGNYRATPAMGSLWYLESGEKMTRTIFVFYGDAATTDYRAWDFSVNAAFTLTVQPRTRHLMGTI